MMDDIGSKSSYNFETILSNNFIAMNNDTNLDKLALRLIEFKTVWFKIAFFKGNSRNIACCFHYLSKILNSLK